MKHIKIKYPEGKTELDSYTFTHKGKRLKCTYVAAKYTKLWEHEGVVYLIHFWPYVAEAAIKNLTTNTNTRLYRYETFVKLFPKVKADSIAPNAKAYTDRQIANRLVKEVNSENT